MSDAPIDDPTLTDTPPETETVTVDVDGDGLDDTWASSDGTVTVIVTDTDGDGSGDWSGIDGNGDEEPDFQIYREGDTVHIVANENFTGGPIDETLSVDDFNAQYPGLLDVTLDAPWPDDSSVPPDTSDPTAPAEPAAPAAPDAPAAPIDQAPVDQATVDDAPYVVDGEIHGDPTQYSENWFAQGWNGGCVPASIAQIYNVYSGTDYTEIDFVQVVNEQHAWGGVTEDGDPYMDLYGAEAVFESQGIPVSVENSDVSGLIDALDSGKGIIVAVDSGEYWYGESTEDNSADHAVVVAAIDEENGIVYLSDTGTPDGDMLAVPLDTFLDAWGDSGNQMLVCDQPAPGFEPTSQVDTAADAATDTSVDTTAETSEDADTEAHTVTGSGVVASEPAASLLTDETRAEFAEVVNWVVTNPWIILPVVLAVRGIIKK